MSSLLRIISYSSLERLRKTALFALSALVRTNSKAQIVFLKLDGLNNILKCLDVDSSKSLKIKAVTLISDLIVEQEDVKKSLVKQGKMAENERYEQRLSIHSPSLLSKRRFTVCGRVRSRRFATIFLQMKMLFQSWIVELCREGNKTFLYFQTFPRVPSLYIHPIYQYFCKRQWTYAKTIRS